MNWTSRKLLVAVYFEHCWIALALFITYARPEHIEVALRTLEALSAITIGGYFLGNVGEWWARRGQ